jgi:Protein of unknown function (DUF664)
VAEEKSGNTVVEGVTQAAAHGNERTTLMGFLQRQRDLIAWKCGGAADDVLRPVSAPSGMAMHGIVRHLENVERSWIRNDFAGEEGLAFDWTDEEPDADFRVPSDTSMADVLASYAAESRRCDEVIMAAPSLDARAAREPELSLRWILAHLIEETARHVGHIDLLRERADGMVGEDPWG